MPPVLPNLGLVFKSGKSNLTSVIAWIEDHQEIQELKKEIGKMTTKTTLLDGTIEQMGIWER